MSTNNQTNYGNVFQGKEDSFKGITVLSNREPCSIEEFKEKLKNSLAMWRSNEKRGIWFKVHLNQSQWVPILVENGFKYHNAKEDYVMLYFWLPTHETNNIPQYSHTMIGVGALVVNEQNQLLVVQEKYFYKAPRWKLPGGYVDAGENLVDAAIREVSEETGILAKFESLLSFRHAHYAMFGCSDIYFVISLKALSNKINKCDREIAECRWMDIDEYLNHPNVHELNKFIVKEFLHHKKLNIKIDCHHGVMQLINKPYTMYHVTQKSGQEAEGGNTEAANTLSSEEDNKSNQKDIGQLNKL